MHVVNSSLDGSNNPELETNVHQISYERHTTKERGGLIDVVEMFESRIGLVSSALSLMEVPLKHGVGVSDRLKASGYVTVDSHSIATDTDVTFGGNLQEQLMHAKGMSVAKIHLNIYGHIKDTSLSMNSRYHKDEVRDMTWAWELGRLAGILLNRVQDPQWLRTLATQRLGIASLMGRVASELAPPSLVLTPDIENMSKDAIFEYYSIAFPERLATTVGNHFMHYYFGADREFVENFNDRLWETAVRPARLASEFIDEGEFSTNLSYADLAAALPLNSREWQVYKEHLSEN